jgi:hypothetical protein
MISGATAPGTVVQDNNRTPGGTVTSTSSIYQEFLAGQRRHGQTKISSGMDTEKRLPDLGHAPHRADLELRVELTPRGSQDLTISLGSGLHATRGSTVVRSGNQRDAVYELDVETEELPPVGRSLSETEIAGRTGPVRRYR